VVRNENRGRTVLQLEYEAYEEMALPLMEASVVIIVSSPHRAEAFAACRFAIDTLKDQVPIWKKELYVDRSAWLDGTPVPPAALRPRRDREGPGRLRRVRGGNPEVGSAPSASIRSHWSGGTGGLQR
jgi:hypothetical protein